MRHSWLTKFGVLCLNQLFILYNTPKYFDVCIFQTLHEEIHFSLKRAFIMDVRFELTTNDPWSTKPFLRALLRWAIGMRLTDRLRKLGLLKGWEWGAWQTPSSGQTPNCINLLRWQLVLGYIWNDHMWYLSVHINVLWWILSKTMVILVSFSLQTNLE